MSLNQALSITNGSLRNNQYAMTVVSQNIANVNVEGYAKQTVQFATNGSTTNASSPSVIIKGMDGASLSDIQDYIDDALVRNITEQTSDAAYYSTVADSLSNLEDIIDALGDQGLNGLMNDFYTSLAGLEEYPTSYTNRADVVTNALLISDKFNDISEKFQKVENDTAESIESDVSAINKLLDDIAELNELYIKTDGNTDIHSQINTTLEELAKLVDYNIDNCSNGAYNIYIGGIKVVSATEKRYDLEAEFNNTNQGKVASITFNPLNDDYRKFEGMEKNISQGTLGANLEFLNGSTQSYSSLKDLKSELDRTANAFANALNEVQTYSSVDPDTGDEIFAANLVKNGNEYTLEKSTQPLFVTNDGSTTITAGNITINSNIINDPNLIAAARIDTSKYNDDSWKKEIANADNAVIFSDVQNQKIIDGYTISDKLTNISSKNGLDIQSYLAKTSSKQSLVDSAKSDYLNLIGVNLDEELSDMLKYQTAYEASAKLFTTINSLFDTIINMV